MGEGEGEWVGGREGRWVCEAGKQEGMDKGGRKERKGRGRAKEREDESEVGTGRGRKGRE